MFGLINRGELPQVVEHELEHTNARVKNLWLVEHNEDGTHKNTPSILQSVYPVGSIYLSVVATNPETLFGFGTWVAFATGRTLVGFNSADTDFDTSEETGGAKTHSHVYTQVPQHNHTITDSGHTHSVTDPTHAHSVSDPTHGHGITDSGHSHGIDVQTGLTGTLVGAGQGGTGATPSTNSATTGISVNNAATGLTVSAGSTGISLVSATTGITINNNGVASPSTNTASSLPPYVVVYMWKRTA